jgi:hypothetical protein
MALKKLKNSFISLPGLKCASKPLSQFSVVFQVWKFTRSIVGQGCQMVYFQTKNPNLGKFLMALD